MKIVLRYCKVTGMKSPRLMAEGWITGMPERLTLSNGKDIIWQEEYEEQYTLVRRFAFNVEIPNCLTVSLTAYKGKEKSRVTIPVHMGVRVVNKLVKEEFPVEEMPDSPAKEPEEITYDPFEMQEYQEWLIQHQKKETESKRFEYQPLISIVIPVYNVEGKYLSECLESILNQTYQNFEICLADDCSTNQDTLNTLKFYQGKDTRIKVCYRKENGHISRATNSAIDMAEGEFVGLVDNDDVLALDALEEVVKALNRDRTLDFIYSDEDKMEMTGERTEPHLKPDFAMDNLLVLNYFCHFSVIRKTILDEIGGFRKGLEGAQDYDLFLRVITKTHNIYHIPKILYHWRKIPGSTAVTIDSKGYAVKASLKALGDYLENNDIDAQITDDETTGFSYKIKYHSTGNEMVDVAIWSDGNVQKLKKTLDEWITRMEYQNYQFIIVSDCKNIKAQLKEYDGIVNIHCLDGVENFNQYIYNSQNGHILFWNMDNTIVESDWLKKIVPYANELRIGAIGSNVVEERTRAFASGYVVIDKQKMIPVRRAYIAICYAQANRCIVGKNAYLVNKKNYVKVNGLDERLDQNAMHYDLQMKLHNKLGRNIVLPQLCYMQKEDIGWEVELPVMESTKNFTSDSTYNPNFSKSIAYKL